MSITNKIDEVALTLAADANGGGRVESAFAGLMLCGDPVIGKLGPVVGPALAGG